MRAVSPDTAPQGSPHGAVSSSIGETSCSTRAWNANAKQTYDNILEQLAAQVKEAQTHITNVNAVRLQTLATMQANADALQNQHTAPRDIATDRTWTHVNELEVMLGAKSGVQADAFVTLLAKSIADAIAAK